MIKIKIKADWNEKADKYTNFTVYLKFTDGIEPILYTNNFNEVMAKIEAIQKAIPQTQNYEVKINE